MGMADEQHLNKLREGVENWNQWRKENPDIKPDLRGTYLRRVHLVGANLIDANLDGANLRDADLADSNFCRAILIDASFDSADLKHANFDGAVLIAGDFTGAILIDTNFRDADLTSAKFYDAILIGANFRDADLSGVNLNNANIKKADLSNVKLKRVQALSTNFESTNLTGACIEDWNINSQTNLQNVKCDYIYLKYSFSKKENRYIFSDRRPHHGNFKKGEFTQLFQKALETVDLIFSEGIEWTAFLDSYQQLQAEVKSEELSIQAIEKKSGSAFVVRLEVPADANKAEIEKYIKQEYEAKLKFIEASYQKQLKAKNEELIKAYREKSIDMLNVVEMLSSSQHKTIINNSPNMISGNTYNQSGQIGIGHNEGEIKGNAKVAGVINEAAQQDLTQVAAEIEQLLDRLQQTNGVTLETAQQQTAKDLATKAQNDPNFKDRLINLGKFVGENSAKTAIGEGVKGVIKLLLLML